MEYHYDKPLSFQAKMVMRALRIFGMKGQTRKKMLENGFDERPAPLPKPLMRGFKISDFMHLGRGVWRLEKDEHGSKTVILYLHGGAFMANITAAHWLLAGKLAEQTGATVYVPDYPLVPRSTWKDTWGFAESLYRKLTAEHAGARIVLMGDSAGGGLALSLAQQLRGTSGQLPAEVILFSPWLDLGSDNPERAALDPLDSILSATGLKRAAAKYADGADVRDPRLSPLYGDFSGLSLSVFTCTHDLLYADATSLKRLLDERRIGFNYFEYPGLFHDWIIFTMLKESEDAVIRAVRIIRGDQG